MNRFGNRFVSIALAAIMIIFSLPLSALAQEPLAADYSCDTTAYDINSDIDQKAVAKEMEEKAGLGILEIESLREESSKHFQLEDGTYQAIAYGMAVHRKDANGKWQDIDNRLYNDPNAEDRYSTDDGRFSFSSVSSSNTLYAVNDGEYTISFGLLLEGMSPSNAIIENHPDRLAIAQSLEGKEKLEALINIDTTTKVVYNQILENMNLEYVITGNDIKEDIILSSPISVEGVAFSMALNGLYAELSEDGYIKLMDDKDGKEIYSIAAPYMYDAAGAESWDIAYTITESNGEYTIGLVVDDEWIHDSDRVFPVVIDPSLTKTITTDTYISSGSPSTNYGSSTELWVSSSRITYMKAAMPTLPTYGKITYATLTAKYYFSATSGSMDIGLHRCMRSWSETSLTWNTANSWTNKGLESTESAAATAAASSGMSSTNPGTVSFSITSLVKGWYAGNSNYGVGLKYKNGSLSSVRLHSRESTSSYRPYFSITYSVISNPVIQNGTYFLKNKKTGRFLDVENNSVTEGANTHQWELNGESTQTWVIAYSHNSNYYTIKSAKSSLYYLRVKDDSTSADVRIILSRGLDSNSTKTLTAGMIWGFSITSSGAYKIGAIVGEPNDRVLAVGSYILNINGIDVEQRNYSNNSDYIDEWECIRKLPTNGSELAYNASAWSGLPSTNCNCYAYAINNQTIEPTGNVVWYKQQPGAYFNLHRYSYENAIGEGFQSPASKIVTSVEKDFAKYNVINGTSVSFAPIGRYDACPAGTYKVALVVSANDYHWYRQDKDGLWSHKQGTTPVKRVDNSGKLIIDPQLADRGSYTTFVGYYAVKPWNNLYVSSKNDNNEQSGNTNSCISMEQFSQIKIGMTVENVIEMVGLSGIDIGSGILIQLYTIDDGSIYMVKYDSFENSFVVESISMLEV